MIKVMIEGLGNTSVRATARQFYDYCSSEGLLPTGPYMNSKGVNISHPIHKMPTSMGSLIKTYIAEIHLATQDTVKIRSYNFPSTVNITIKT